MRTHAAPHCDCCQGIVTATPARMDNPPGQAAIAYRNGSHAQFLAAMQARLSSSAYPALAAFGSREASDFTLAMADALATSLEVLAFYTERFANEHTLRTATERLSVIELARLIGYQAAPGVAASTHLAFTLQDVPGAPLGPITIPVGTRVQSVPGQDEVAQTFETVAAITARAGWNALAAQQTVRRPPAAGDTRLWLQGNATGLAAGDMLLIAAIGPEGIPADVAHWSARVLSRVTVHAERALTEVAWRQPLGADTLFSPPPGEKVRIFALRKRTAVFGASAADWRALSDDAKASYIGLSDAAQLARPGDLHEWPDFSVLAPVYPEQRQGSDAIVQQLAPATLEQVALAATSIAEATATQAMHTAASRTSGVLAAGGAFVKQALASASESAAAVTEAVKLASEDVVARTKTAIDSFMPDVDVADPVGSALGSIRAKLANLGSATSTALLAFNAELNPAGHLATLGDAGAAVNDTIRSAAQATLGAAAAADVAGLVSAAVTIARMLPAQLAPRTPEAMAEIIRHFAALGVARAGGSPVASEDVSGTIAAISTALPPTLQSPLDMNALGGLLASGEDLVNAPREGAQHAYAAIVSQVDHVLLGSLTTTSSRRAALVRAPDSIDLFPANDAVTAGGWALLSVPGQRALYRIVAAGTGNRAEYLLSGQTTRLQLAGPMPNGRLPAAFEHAVRGLSVHVESEALQLADTPLAMPVYGETLALDALVEGLLPGQAIALGGPAPRIAITHAGRGTPLLAASGSALRTLAEGDSLRLIAAPERLVGNASEYLAPAAFGAALGDASQRLRLQLADRDGRTGHIAVQGSAVTLADALEADDAQAEIAFIAVGDEALTHDRDRSTLRLAKAMTRVYDRRRLRINANVAPATHGETVHAIAGSGDGSLANQRFTLAQAPLTHVSAATPSGSASTLELRVNEVLWQERASLFAAPAEARVFETTRDDRGVTTVQFGDGHEGARLPSGSANVRVRYRKGLGVAGNVAAGALTTLLSRPLGVAGVANPVAATGGEDAEPLERARENAPVTVLTLERAVSVSDYANFARAFAGIAKAHAVWIAIGPARGMFLSIAGVDGAPVPEDGSTFVNLRNALRAHGDAQLPLYIVNHVGLRFRCRLAVKVLARHAPDAVLSMVDAALRRHFAFAARQFGQPVSVDEVAAVAQAVAGVEAVHALRLHHDGSAISLTPRLFARLPQATPTAPPSPAEILTLAADGLELEVLP